MSDTRAPNYWEYIKVEELLALQGGLEDDESRISNEEVLFITVHQVYELWFKLILRELGSLRDLFRQDPDSPKGAKLPMISQLEIKGDESSIRMPLAPPPSRMAHVELSTPTAPLSNLNDRA